MLNRRRHPQPACRAGFTLVELLTVVGIIALLIGILLPSLSRARDQAKRVNVGGMLSSIDKALEMFHNDFGNYPDSSLREDVIQGLPTPPAYTSTPNNAVLSGAHWLARAVVGFDGQGPVADGSTFVDGSTVAAAQKPTAANLLTAERRPAYMDGPIYSRDDNPNLFLTQGTYSPTGRLVLYENYFKSPVLYYRANPRGKAAFATDRTANPAGTYLTEDNILITGRERTPNKGWAFGGVFYSSDPDEPAHALGVEGWDNSGSQQTLNSGLKESFAQTVHNPSAWGSTGILKASNSDRFILITAGKDQVLGTKDDVSNFKSGL